MDRTLLFPARSRRDRGHSGSHSNEARDSSDVGFALLSRFAKTKQANDGIFQSH